MADTTRKGSDPPDEPEEASPAPPEASPPSPPPEPPPQAATDAQEGSGPVLPARASAPARSWIPDVLLQDRTVTLLVLGCAALSVAVPLCLARYVPFVDYPDHLAQIATIANINDPRFAPYYELALGKSQYFSFYLPAALLAKMFGTEIGTRIALIAALAGLPLAVAVFLRAHGRSALPAAAAAFIGINMQAYWGFINFVEGVTLGILAVAAHAHLVNKPSTRRAVLFGLAAVVTFYAHAYAYVWLVAACFFQTLAMLPTVGMRQTLASAWRAVVAGVPSVLALFIWLHNSQVLEHGEAGGRIEGDAAVVASRPTFTPPMEMVERWIDHSFGVYVDGAGTKVATACLLAIGVLFLLRIALSRPWRKESDPAWGMGAPEAVLALSVGAYLFAPESYKLVGGINPRFIVTTFALLPVLAPIALSPRLRLAVGAGLVGLLAYCSTVHIEHFRRLDAEMGDLDQALAQTAPGKRLLGLNFDPRSAELLFLPAFLHAHQYYQSRIGGMSAWGFVELPHSPIVYRPGAAPAPFPPRFEWEPEQFDWSRWGDSFDYFLVRTQQGRNTPWSFRYDATIGRVHALFEGSRWKLYERVAAPPPQALAKVDPGPDQLIVRDVVDGTGEAAAGGSMVSIHFTRSLVDGSGPFSTHAGRGDPHVFKLGAEENLRAFNLGLVGMKVGGKRELIVPEGLGYGKAGLEPTVPPRAGLIFEVDLLGVRRP